PSTAIIESLAKVLWGHTSSTVGSLSSGLAPGARNVAALKLTGRQEEALRDALFDAYPNEQDVQDLLKYGMDNLTLEQVSRGGTLPQRLGQLISWTIAHGRLEELVLVAINRREDNPSLKALIEDDPGFRSLVKRRAR